MEHSHTHSFKYCLWLLSCYNGKVVDHKKIDKPKMFSSNPLQNKLAGSALHTGWGFRVSQLGALMQEKKGHITRNLASEGKDGEVCSGSRRSRVRKEVWRSSEALCRPPHAGCLPRSPPVTVEAGGRRRMGLLLRALGERIQRRWFPFLESPVFTYSFSSLAQGNVDSS